MLCVKVFQILLLGVTRDSSYNEQNAVWGGTPPQSLLQNPILFIYAKPWDFPKRKQLEFHQGPADKP